jgi:hypothetical protein
VSFDLSSNLRAAIVANSGITALLDAYHGSFPVFTRRPIPDDAEYPVIVISPDITHGNEDGVNDSRPVIVRDIAVYGSNETPETYRVVEELGYRLRDLFHRQPGAITVVGATVVQITTTGPVPGPTDDEKVVARVVPVTVRLAHLN